jgi:hypothetical protein
MSTTKKAAAKSDNQPAILSHGGSMLKDQGLQEETIKEPLLTAPELPINMLDKKKPAAKEKEKPAAPAVKKAEPPAEEDTGHIISVKRLSIKPLSEAKPAEPVAAKSPAAEPAEAVPAPTPAKVEPPSQVQPLIESLPKPEPEPEPAPSSEAEPEAPAPDEEPDKPAEPEPPKPPEFEPVPEAEPMPAAETAPEKEPELEEASAASGTDQPANKKADPEAEAKQQADHDAAIQKLVDNKQYFLPINAVEQRRSKRFVALGVLLSLFLLVAWCEIALDAGLIDVPGIQPLTHFFSN